MLVRPSPRSNRRPLLQQHQRGHQSDRHPQHPRSQPLSVNKFVAIFSAVVVFVLYIYMLTRGKMSVSTPHPNKAFHYKFEVLKGYFKQSEDETDDLGFDFIKEKFGLIERDYPTDSASTFLSQWQRFSNHVWYLNQSSGPDESVKVLFLGRHGQGWHNVAETKYGTAQWDCYWSMLEGADGITWADANLTQLGQGQATAVNGLWKELLNEGIPSPEAFYVSPLTRTIETADLSFKELKFEKGKEYKPYIKELLREALGVHTCDRRSTASHISSTFPHVTFEPGFSDKDLLWEKDYREPRLARKYRLEQLLDDIFKNDDGVFLSLTSHSGAIRSILEAVGHRTFGLETGGVIPVLVKAKRVEGKRLKPPKEPNEAPPLCKDPPVELPN